MPVKPFKERAEFLALVIIVTEMLAHRLRSEPKLAKQLVEGVDRAIDTFEFTDGWAETDVLRGREYMRIAADWIIGPAIRRMRRR